ncbi:PAS domain S-box protein [Sutcliffiella halmapala]|uniref:PAS domain S-box protein n=1 Tax=Sutcliffiella halmapala TaxID=79882 RepID=UPI000995B2F7|nr:PAS domain S-box protein [Sutcliffiella halmapala]
MLEKPHSLMKNRENQSVESISKIHLIIIISPTGNILYTSSSCESLLGYQNTEIVETQLEEWIHAEDLYLIGSLIYKPSHQAHCFFRMKTKDSDFVWMEATLSEIQDPVQQCPKEIVLQLTQTSDIGKLSPQQTNIKMNIQDTNEDTYHIEKQSYVQETEQDYSAYDLIEHLANGLFITVDGIIKYVNEAGMSMLGAYDKNQLINTSVYDYIDENYHEIVQQRIKSVQQGFRVGLMEQRWYRLDGRIIEVEITSNQTMYKGKSASFIMLMDISHRKNFHKILQNSRERFRKLVQNSIDTIGVICDEKWTFINDSGVKMLEVDSYGELIGQSIYKNIDKEDFQHIWSVVHSHQNGNKLPTFEQEWTTMKNHKLYTELIGIPTTYLGKEALQVIIRDITERKQAEAVMLQSEKLSVAGQLAAGIAHEIRNPLTAIKGFFKLLEREIDQKQEYFHIIESELSRIELILSELLLLAKPHQVRVQNVALDSLLKDVTTLLETQAIMNNVWFDMKLEADNPFVKCDDNQVKQVFINLIKNGIEAMSEGGIIFIETKDVDDEVVISIRDEGKGIPEEVIARLGEPFFTTKTTGTGLGLMITFNIIKNHQGLLSVKSEVNVGTTFEVRFHKE